MDLEWDLLSVKCIQVIQLKLAKSSSVTNSYIIDVILSTDRRYVSKGHLSFTQGHAC